MCKYDAMCIHICISFRSQMVFSLLSFAKIYCIEQFFLYAILLKIKCATFAAKNGAAEKVECTPLMLLLALLL